MNEVDQALQEIEAKEQGINAELLGRVADYIETASHEFDMDTWWSNGGSLINRLLVKLHLARPQYTIGCVACHTVRLGDGNISGNIPAEAQRLLRLTDQQALRLFYVGNWPKTYRKEYSKSNLGSESRAWISAQRFRHFIATNGAE